MTEGQQQPQWGVPNQQPQWGAPNQQPPQHQPAPPPPSQWQQQPPQGPPPGYPQQYPPQSAGYGQQPYGQPHPQQAPAPQWQQQPAQFQHGQPQFGQRPPSPLGTGSLLNIHTGFFPLAFILFLTGPLIVIDGIEVGRNWGNQAIELAPGVHTIHIHTRYLWAIGKADQQFQIAPGQQLNASYETPFWAFSAGRIDFR
ncbi:hypothetical protein [Gordonia hydrophobica]|uniref:PEGA domain-containing protein n=1 Tax=Gordonia hydrophobica TaxID=40516 RepID=A0ABZ2U2M5_9ACTN|nr:hypothetical protein [Gordonia hydrophobica]MBM7368984.1 hypothetical protein [Gordonia hydrophobica]